MKLINLYSKFLLVLIVNLFYISSIAQGPKSPEAASFEPIDAADMVNLISGDFSYVLPLMEIPGPGGGYPLSLAYHSGIAMGQEASWVGLGWNINPGAINRNISGVPDDWKRIKKHTTFYDKGGAFTSYSLGVSVGERVGLYGTYTENKTFGGENSYSFDFGLSVNVPGSNGSNIGGRIGTDGVGINAAPVNKGYLSRVGISVSQSFKNGSTSIGLRASGTTKYLTSSLGVSFNTKGGLSLTSGFGSTSLSGGNVNTSINFKNDNFSIVTPFANFEYSRQRWWLFDTDYTQYNGSLYAGDFSDLLDENVFDKVSFDGYESLYAVNRNNNIENTNYTTISYDRYSVSAQGVTGTIQPQLFQEGVLKLKYSGLTTDNEGKSTSNASYRYPNGNDNGDFSKTISNNNLHFYFNNENASYLKVKSNNWNTPTISQYPTIFSFNTLGQSIDDSINIEGTNYDGFDENSQRKRGGSFVETYTNEQIINALQGSNSINFKEAKGVIRNSNFPNDGIGGFKVTTTDGKTYHYSLPVYQKETFSRSSELDKNIDDNFFEEAQLDPYATHWLLTAITGPDYIDVNSNHSFDENDFGYWVEFEYGKWSDGYSWRTPTGSNEYDKNINSKKYSWGVKEIYYLDKIRTKTHTALFIKETRLDNKSSIVSIRDGDNPKKYRDNFTQRFLKGDDNYWYIDGVYDKYQTGSSIPPVHQIARSEHKYFFQTYKQKSLKLSKIILLKNDSPFSNISKTNIQAQNPIKVSEHKIDEDYLIFEDDSLIFDDTFPIFDETWYGEYYNNVLDIDDVNQNAPNIEEQALQVIDFNQDYAIMPNSPNSDATNKGKLRLNSVLFRGKGGASLIPTYNFRYNSFSTPYDNDAKDDWGFNENNPTAWNLNEIKTPTGQKLNIQYEEDDYYEEAAITNFVFDDRLQLRFYGTNETYKTLRIRNHPDNLDGQDVNFIDYFDENESAMIDVLVWQNPDHGGSHRVADIAKVCSVISVSANEVVFGLGTWGTNDEVRRGENCHNTNWSRFYHYTNVNGGITGMQWISKERATGCDDPGNGNRRVRYYIYSNKENLNNYGGGIRVNNLSITSDTDDSYATNYDYNVPGSTTSSGITSYSPSNMIKEVKYINEIPGPSVMYKYVTVTKKDKTGNVFLKDLYEFNVLTKMTLTDGGFNLGDFLSLNRNQNINSTDIQIDGRNSDIYQSKFELTNNLSSLGRLNLKKTFNSENQLLSKNKYSYKNNVDIKQGITQESFKSYKRVSRGYFADHDYFLSSSSEIVYPNILMSVESTDGISTNKISNSKYDFLTGQVIETTTSDSKGLEIKTQTIPAYTKYPNMGSKVDDINNKNMLSQEAANYTFIKKNGTWKPIGVGITTWNNNWDYRALDGTISSPTNPTHKIWRKHKSFIWDGDIDAEGVYTGFNVGNDDGFNWDNPNASPAPWKKVSETTMYDHYSMPLEVKDINNNYASTKMWDDETKIFSTSNAKYTEHFTFNAEKIESYNGIDYLGDGIERLNEYALLNEEKSHTGKYSFPVNSWNENFNVILKSGEHREGNYRMSVWIHKDNYDKALIRINDKPLTPFNGEIVEAGNWVQLNHVMHFDTSEQRVYITSSDGRIYLDDFRLSPIESTVSTYVYNDYDELEATLGANNMATKYQYDDAGRLIRVWQEVADTPTITGGFKRASEYRYNYGREINDPNDDPSNDVVYFEVLQTGNTGTLANPSATIGKLYGPVGANVHFQMSVSDCDDTNEGDDNSSGTFTIGSNSYVVSCGNNSTNSITIPASGWVNCSTKFIFSHEAPNIPATGIFSRIVLTSTSEGFISGNDRLEDTEFN